MSAPDAGRRVTYSDVLAVPEFRGLYVAQALSLLGDQVAKIAIALLVFDRSHSALLTALSYAFTFLPWLIGGPWLSVYADRLPRHQVMIACDLVRAVVVLGIATPGIPVWLALVLVFAVALLEPPFTAARSALVPEILTDESRVSVASGLLITTSQLAQVVGFAGGGLLAALGGPRGAIVVDSLTFLVSAGLVRGTVRRRPAAATARLGTRGGVRAALRYLAGHRLILNPAITSWAVVLSTIAPEAIAVPYARAHGGGAATAGLLTAALPLGGLVGAVVMGRLLAPEVGTRLMPWLALATPTFLALTAFDPPPAGAFALWAAAGVCSSCVVVAGRLLVWHCEPAMRGRVMGLAGGGLAVAQGLGALIAGLVASRISPAVAVADASLPMLAVLVCLHVSPRWRSSDDLFAPNGEQDDHVQSPTIDTPAMEDGHRPGSNRRVWVLSGVLAAVSLLILLLVRHDRPVVASGLSPLWVLLLFFTVRSFPLFFEFRHKLLTVALDSVPLLLALFFLSPLELFAVRVSADVASNAVRRQPRLHAVFNAANTSFYGLTSILIFHAVAPGSPKVGFTLWAAAVVALLSDDVVSAMTSTTAAFLAGRPVRVAELGTPLLFSTVVTLVNACLGFVTACAVVYDASSIWAITVFVILALVGFRTYHRLADRHAILDRLYAFVRDLGPISSDRSDVSPALSQLRLLVRARELELVLLRDGDAPPTSIAVIDDGDRERVRVQDELHEADDDLLKAQSRSAAGGGLLGRRRRRGWMSADYMAVPVTTAARRLGVLRATSRVEDGRRFERDDLRLLEAVADQLGAALEKGHLIENLRIAATRDSLTGLPNLDSLRDFLSAMLREGSSGVLLLLDIDRFHDINDTLGHEAGDRVLVEVSRRLEDAAMQGSLASRVGADQFALVVPGQSSGELARLAALAVKSRLDGPLRFADVSADVRVTIGVARSPEHGVDATTLLRRAEIALGSAKGGSTGISEWEPDMERDGSRRLYVLSGLRQALSDSDLRVEFQPKLRLGTGDVTGFEALVRWRHPSLGLVPPSEFIPLAEATGLIGALTSSVLRMALETLRRWHDQGKYVTMAVNISARSLDDPILVGQVAALLTATGLESRWLTLEITESSVMQNASRSLDVLRQLRSLGVGLSIDDFGTGYSSLHQLRGLPVHEVKIDKTFVDNVGHDGADRAVIRAVVELCESLGLTTVAEGVEHAEQAYALESLGVQEVQGYFYGRPMTEADATSWMRHRPVADKLPRERQRG